MQWRNTSNGEQHRYDYTYDGLGRLTHSDYSSSALGTEGRFDETVSYNPNGSIETLLRSGMKNDGTFGTIDNLAISYDGNRLLKVTDNAEAVNYNGSLDFHDGADTECEYEYDSNGALTKDSNRGIKSITYDYGHHPQFISMSTMRGRSTIGRINKIINDYTSDGRKLSSAHTTSIIRGRTITKTSNTTDLYIDGLIVRNGTPLLWQFDGGYVDLDANGAPTSWNYYVTDHLGSTRMVVDSKNNIKETINYYPFGSEMKMETPAQMQQTENANHPFRFTGKELDKQNGLNWYDFGARWFDVAGLPMWTSVDPLAEKYYHLSPYVYCENNPVRFIDPTGKAPGDFFQKIDDAAKDFGLYYNDNSIRLNKEIASYIFEIKDDNGNVGYSYSIASIGKGDESNLTSELGAKNVATIHTHAAYDPDYINGNNVFSGSFDSKGNSYSPEVKKTITQIGKDIGNANIRKMDSYLVTPNGSLQKYNCSTGVVSVLSNEMPSDVNDPDRLNLIDIRERHPVSTSDLLRYQENINKGILNSIIK